MATTSMMLSGRRRNSHLSLATRKRSRHSAVNQLMHTVSTTLCTHTREEEEEEEETASGNVEAKVVCFYRRRDISHSLIQLADKHAILEQ
ncbi:hypothetical protein CRUP_021674 [Coryphaenoides rupestris]|nr:hypothetical protein CRUP_021674 [Coryphaenoides rupestris]